MKTWQYVTIMVWLVWIVANQQITKEHLELTQNDLKVVDSLLRDRVVKDSLYREHLQQCSFISNDQLQIGYQGYLRVKK